MSVLDTTHGVWTRLAAAMGHPVRVVVGGFVGAILVGSLLLLLPVATADGNTTGPLTAVFTATSAVCVTGLVVVDTNSHWSTFGEVVILGLIQVGGLGIMTLASVLALLVGDRLGVRVSALAEAEGRRARDAAAGTRQVVRGVVRTTLIVEGAVAAALAVRFAVGYGESVGRAAYLGVFHAISSFNNAGFALWHNSLERFATDPWICLPIMVAIVTGGLGFPVLWELRRHGRSARAWSLHTKMTITVTAVLLLASSVLFTVVEWSNDRTLGALSRPGRMLAGVFHAVNTRTAGFNSVPTADLRSESLLASDVLMFIGGGSAGTAGGIKVTTFFLLACVLWAELRGERRVSAWRRAVPPDVQRQALTVALLAVAAVVGTTWLLLALTDHALDDVLFEVISAFGTVGLSTGITAQLPPTAQSLLIALMLLGRVGPLTLGAALALTSRPRRFDYPEERPIVG